MLKKSLFFLFLFQHLSIFATEYLIIVYFYDISPHTTKDIAMLSCLGVDASRDSTSDTHAHSCNRIGCHK